DSDPDPAQPEGAAPVPLRLRLSRFVASCLAALVATAALAGAVFTSPAATAAGDELAGVSITGATDEKPTVAVDKPVSVKSTVTKVVSKGSGDKATKDSIVSLDYTFVNARTGDELETSYGQAPQSITLDRKKFQPVIVDGLVGKRVGSRVMIAI